MTQIAPKSRTYEQMSQPRKTLRDQVEDLSDDGSLPHDDEDNATELVEENLGDSCTAIPDLKPETTNEAAQDSVLVLQFIWARIACPPMQINSSPAIYVGHVVAELFRDGSYNDKGGEWGRSGEKKLTRFDTEPNPVMPWDQKSETKYTLKCCQWEFASCGKVQ
ncbi:hypothetical protein PG984_007173 [Apiospora sp. TS-2023a]